MPAAHPLAHQADRAPPDLAGQEWIAVLHKESGLKHDNSVAACARAGFTPDIRLEATEPLTALGPVAGGLGMAMIQHSLPQHAPAGVVVRDLPWFSYRTPLWLAWRKVDLRPLAGISRPTQLQQAGVAV
ncbi:hypothetical protein CSZ94_22695 [Janthinobacterium sp. ROICE36]|uniref:LysR family substrate-binding domain-containing protein n=1 Tax=Janthinobacterium sp. ROICE36 TaxID=2048670 RepID=UPI000C7EA1E4|nr:hypothetical protein CSZ94_22695 [Janthinobacterium sp. ROICE36]